MGRMYAAPTNREFIDWMDDESSAPFSKKENPGDSRRGFPVSFRSRYFFFFFFLNDLWHAPHCLPMRPTAFLMAAGPPL